MYSHLIHRPATKKVKQDTARHIFYCEFGILCLLWHHLKDPALALCMNVKQAHVRSLFSMGLVVSQTRREWVGDAGSSQGGTCPHPCHSLFL